MMSIVKMMNASDMPMADTVEEDAPQPSGLMARRV